MLDRQTRIEHRLQIPLPLFLSFEEAETDRLMIAFLDRQDLEFVRHATS